MATTIYSTNDGRVINYETTSWTDTRDATSGNSSSTASNQTTGIQIYQAAGRGGTTYGISRAFFQFDTRSITHLPKSATLDIYGLTNNAAGVSTIVKGTQDSSLSINDFDAIEGWQTGGVDNRLNVTIYGNYSSWSTSGYNSTSLVQIGLVDIAGLDTFKVCVLQNLNDLRAVTPSGTVSNSNGFFTSAKGGTTQDPKLVITEQENSVFFGTNL